MNTMRNHRKAKAKGGLCPDKGRKTMLERALASWKSYLFLLVFAFSAFPGFIPLPLPQPLSAIAAVPIKFTYQGNLRESGFLVNGSKNMVFRLYDSSTTAIALWTSGASSVDISTGVFKVDLEPSISDWESGNLWIGLEVEGVLLLPREEITSSPYAINALMHSGKRYTTSALTPTIENTGDLWMDTSLNVLKYYDGTAWVSTGGAGLELHADSHEGDGTDPIMSLGTHSVTGPLSLDAGAFIKAGVGASNIFIATDTVISGTLNPSSDLSIGGAGYSVTLASAVIGGWFYGNGAGLEDINASNITSGYLPVDRILDGSVTRLKFDRSGCGDGQLLKWDGIVGEWICSNLGALVETDPYSVHIQETLQEGATFYVSSGTVNYLTVNNHLDVLGTARIKGGPSSEGIFVNSSGNVGIGALNPVAKLEVLSDVSHNYSLAVGTSTAYSMVVSTSGNMGVGEVNPQAKVEVTGSENSGEYIMIFNSGPNRAAWLRNK